MVQIYAHYILRFRWLVIILSLLIIAITGYGIQYLQFKSDYRMFFSEENPQLIAYESLQKTYTKDDNVLLVITPENNNVFTSRNLAIAEELTHNLWQTPHSTRVDSITNFQYSHAKEDDLIVENLVNNAEQLSKGKISQIKEYALNEPLLVNRLVSPDARVMGFNIVIQRPGINQNTETNQITEFIRQQAKQLKLKYPDLDIRITGSVMMDTAFAESSELDMRTLTPAMLIVIIIVLWLLIKSGWGVLAAATMITLSIVAAVGLAGWMNIAFSPSSIPAPTILLTLAVANTVHILTSYYNSLAHGVEKFQSMVDSLKGNFKAIFFTNLSTAIGFLSMNFSESPPFRDLGNITAMGVGVAFILAISFLPALVVLLPATKNKISINSNKIWEKLADQIMAHGRTYFIFLTIVVMALIACIPMNTLDDEYVKYFNNSVEFRQDTDYTTDNLTGIYRIDYSLKSSIDGGINDPEFLRKVDAFVEWYRQQPETIHVFAITDILKRLNQNMHGD
ncbi:MAG: MMPL family transporter, partial [Nitrosomonas sp.]|nr:MMPL family transporter [Nitrosomonas sp.]